MAKDQAISQDVWTTDACAECRAPFEAGDVIRMGFSALGGDGWFHAGCVEDGDFGVAAERDILFACEGCGTMCPCPEPEALSHTVTRVRCFECAAEARRLDRVARLFEKWAIQALRSDGESRQVRRQRERRERKALFRR